MQERRKGTRHNISFPIRLSWRNEEGQEVIQEGLTENVGPHGTLVFVPRNPPNVTSKVTLTVTENPKEELSFSVQVIRVERNAAHPQVAFQLTDSLRLWRKKVWEYAGELINAEKPEDFDDWS